MTALAGRRRRSTLVASIAAVVAAVLVVTLTVIGALTLYNSTDGADASSEDAMLTRSWLAAKATTIYAAAYSQSAEARNLYAFVKTMGTYKKVVSENDTLVLSTHSDLYRFLSDASGGGAK